MANNFCEKCGTRREGDARFCIKCGFRFEDDTQITAVQEFNDAEIAEAMQIVREEEGQEPSDKENSLPVQTASQEPQVKEEEPIKTKKASYKGEVLLLMLSLICFIGSLGFYLATKTTLLDSIPFIAQIKNPESNTVTAEIPELTVEMAEEIINNTICCFPYYYFEGKGMLNKNDYVIHPISVGTGHEVKCYTADGINTKEDFFNHFKQYVADDNLVKEIFAQEHFYIEQNSKIYFSPNEWMGWEYYSSEIMVLEKIDNETYLTYMGYDDPHIIKYVDGSFKLSAITLEEAIAPYADEDATVVIPKISGMTLDEAEAELRKVGLTLDRNNITYIATGYYMDSEIVLRAKEYYKKVKPGASIGFYYVVEDPEFYRRGTKNGETIPTLTVDEAENILNVADNFSLMYFQDNDMIDENDIITVIQPDFGYECNAYSPIGIETEEDYFAFLKKYATSACTTGFYHSNYMIIDGKIYFHELDGVGDGGYGKDCLIVEKIDDATYFVFDTYYYREHIIIYVDGAFKLCVTEPDTVRELCNEAGATVEVPDISGMTIEEAERELNRVGLYLDRSNMSSVTANGWDGKVLIAKDYCKKVKPGSSVGVYLVKEFVYY